MRADLSSNAGFHTVLLSMVAVVGISCGLQEEHEVGATTEDLLRSGTLKQVGILFNEYRKTKHGLPDLWIRPGERLKSSSWRLDLVEWKLRSVTFPSRPEISSKELNDWFNKLFIDSRLSPVGGSTVVAVIDARTASWNDDWKIDGKSVLCASVYRSTCDESTSLGWISSEDLKSCISDSRSNTAPKVLLLLDDGTVNVVGNRP